MDTKTLRQKILNLAIRGKLVPQNPDDEPASVLLEKIRLEKQNMVKEGKLKPKDVKNDTIIFRGDDNLHYEKFQNGTVKCIEDEIPFEVPEGWEWCRLKNICMMSAGKFKSSDLIKDEPFDSSYPCFGGNGIRGYVDEFNQDGTFSIVGRQGALCGNINIATGKFYATEHAVVTYLYSGIDFSWNNYILEALNLNSYASGAAQPGLSVANVLNILVPLPSHDEQSRIGNKISTASSLIEKIDNQKKELLNIINLANIKTLELAIHGKLVPQNSGDESASVLLERIRSEKENLIKAGKIKRDKKESVIYRGDDNSYYEKFTNGVCLNIDSEIPFQLPQGWGYERLRNLFIVNPKNNLPNETEVSFIPMTLLDNQYSGKYKFESKNWKECKKGFTHFANGDVAFAKISPCFENRKSTYFHNLINGYGAGTTELYVLRFFNCDLCPRYILNVLKSDYFINRGKGSFSGVVGQQRVDREVIFNTLIPVPPKFEQNKIVQNVIRFMDYIEIIEAALI